MANVFDVAAYILSECGEMTTMKLQKLVYYCQAWSLVWDETPIFPETIEAWANGPVVRELYNHHQGQFRIRTIGKGKPDNLKDEEKQTIKAVLDYYKDFTSQQLSERTHEEPPWKGARSGLKDGLRGNEEISLASMAEYYGSL